MNEDNELCTDLQGKSCEEGVPQRRYTLHENLLRRRAILEDNLKTVNEALAIVEEDPAAWSATYATLRAANRY